ncbi:MAG: MBL fold metallo-hydrolase [Candidatus Gracilibacteria bacterium]|nr:MBL fold metallo-hydrolase [Candidatus Gracilibacteria bacterium]
MDITSRNNQIVITSDKKEIVFESPASIVLDGLVIDFFGEYEKSGFLATFHEVEGKNLFTLRVEGKNIAYVPTNTLDITENVVNFLGNIDILILPGDKNATKIFENLEARIVVPYGEETSVFLSSLGQNIEMVDKYKTKETDFESEATVFVRVGN